MGLCGSSNASSGGGSLTAEDIANVQATWKIAYSQWDAKHGMAFFYRLFTKHRAAKQFFAKFENLQDDELMGSAELKAHTMVFAQGMEGLVQNLADTNKLVDMIHKMTDSHVKMGITFAYFKAATGELLSYLVEALNPNQAQKQSWQKTVNILNKVIEDRIKQNPNPA